MSESTPTPEGEPGAAAAMSRGVDAGARRWLLPCGLIAGMAAFFLGETTYRIIPARTVMLNTMGTVAPAVTAETKSEADIRNAAVAFAILGGCLAGGLGAAGGLARRSGTATAGAGFLGLVLGAGLAAGVSLATLRPFAAAQFTYSDHDLEISMLMHGTIWGLAGATAGLAFAVGAGSGLRRIVVAMAMGFLGAALGAVAFDLVGAAIFATADTGDPVSTTWPSRLTARMLVALGTALALIPAFRRAPSG